MADIWHSKDKLLVFYWYHRIFLMPKLKKIWSYGILGSFLYHVMKIIWIILCRTTVNNNASFSYVLSPTSYNNFHHTDPFSSKKRVIWPYGIMDLWLYHVMTKVIIMACHIAAHYLFSKLSLRFTRRADSPVRSATSVRRVPTNFFWVSVCRPRRQTW